MSHSLIQGVSAVCHQAHRALLWHAWGRTTIVATIAFSLLSWIDYVWRPTEFIASLALPLLLWLTLFAAAKHWLWQAWRARPSLLETAWALEQRYPELAGLLTGSLELVAVSDNDPHAGSVPLRERVIATAQARLAPLPLHELVAPQPRRRGVAWLILALAVWLVALTLWPGSLAIAGQRLLMPWLAVAWPRNLVLQFDSLPRRMARGSSCDVIVRGVTGRLPADVQLLVQRAGRIDTLAMQARGEEQVHRFDAVTTSFSVRAIGGDDHTMPWHFVEVVDPLELVSSTLRVIPPRYAGPSWEAPEKSCRVLAGSTLELSGELARSAGTLLLRSRNPGGKSEIPLQLDAAGTRFKPGTALWQPAKSGLWDLIAVDAEGLEFPAARTYDIHVIPDQSPSVQLDSRDEDWLLTPQARVNVTGQTRDDFGVRQIVLRYTSQLGDRTKSGEILFFSDQADPPATLSGKETTSGELRSFSGTWDFAPLALTPGERIMWHIAATDSVPQQSTSLEQHLTILSADELLERLASRFRSALTQLSAALAAERNAREHVARIGDEEPPRRVADLLALARDDQRQVQQRTATVVTRLASVLQALEENQLSAATLHKSTALLKANLEQLGTNELTPLAALLAAAGSTAGETSLAPATRDSLLAQQDRVIERLEELLREHDQREALRRLEERLAAIASTQRDMQQRTLAAQQRAFMSDKPSDAEREQLAALAREQSAAARNWEQWQGEAARLVQSESFGAEQALVAQALAQAATTRLAAHMQSAQRALNQERPGEAGEHQAAALAGLTAVQEALAEKSPESSPAEQSASPAEEQALAAQLALWLDRLERVLTSTAEASKLPSPEAMATACSPLAEELHALAGELDAAAAAQGNPPAFATQLRQGAKLGRSAAAELSQTQPVVALPIEQRLRQLLRRLDTALQNDPPPAADEEKPAETKSPSSPPEQAKGLDAATLRLLLAWQREIQLETARLAEAVEGGSISEAEQRRTANALAEDQAQLRALLPVESKLLPAEK